jgi:hypothetical protein
MERSPALASKRLSMSFPDDGAFLDFSTLSSPANFLILLTINFSSWFRIISMPKTVKTAEEKTSMHIV